MSLIILPVCLCSKCCILDLIALWQFFIKILPKICGYRSDGFSFGPMSIGLNLISEFEKIHQKNNCCLNLFFLPSVGGSNLLLLKWLQKTPLQNFWLSFVKFRAKHCGNEIMAMKSASFKNKLYSNFGFKLFKQVRFKKKQKKNFGLNAIAKIFHVLIIV